MAHACCQRRVACIVFALHAMRWLQQGFSEVVTLELSLPHQNWFTSGGDRSQRVELTQKLLAKRGVGVSSGSWCSVLVAAMVYGVHVWGFA